MNLCFFLCLKHIGEGNPQLFKFAAAHQKANSVNNPVCWWGVMGWGEKSRIQQLRERKLQKLRVECLVPLLAVLSLCTAFLSLPEEAERPACPEWAPRVLWARGKGCYMEFVLRGRLGEMSYQCYIWHGLSPSLFHFAWDGNVSVVWRECKLPSSALNSQFAKPPWAPYCSLTYPARLHWDIQLDLDQNWEGRWEGKDHRTGR